MNYEQRQELIVSHMEKMAKAMKVLDTMKPGDPGYAKLQDQFVKDLQYYKKLVDRHRELLSET